MKTLIATMMISTLTLFAGASAFAEDALIPVDCQKAAVRKAYIQLRQDSGWNSNEANQNAYLHDPIHQEGDPADVVTVSVESTDIRVWDGYAAYKVKVVPTRDGCDTSAAVLTRGEGF